MTKQHKESILTSGCFVSTLYYKNLLHTDGLAFAIYYCVSAIYRGFIILNNYSNIFIQVQYVVVLQNKHYTGLLFNLVTTL